MMFTTMRLYIRMRMLLLYVSSGVSFQNLLTVGEIVLTFKATCLRYSLLPNDDTLENPLLEAAACQMSLVSCVTFAALHTYMNLVNALADHSQGIHD